MSFSYIVFVRTQKRIYFNFEKITSSANEFLNWLNNRIEIMGKCEKKKIKLRKYVKIQLLSFFYVV